MVFATYYFTLLVMLASVLAGAACFSAYLVSRSRAMALAGAGFLCYFLDVAFMLQDSIADVVLGTAAVPGYLMMRTIATILIGAAFLTFFWLLLCAYVGERNRILLSMPPVVFLVLSVALLPGADTPDGRFWFYSLRMFYVVWILGFGAFRYVTCHDATERTRMARGKVVFVVIAILTCLVIAEDVALFLVLQADSWSWGPIVITAERNYVENFMMLTGALLAIFYASRSLSLRFTEPPMDDNADRAAHVGDNLAIFANRYGLTNREREVLQLLLQGKDNQNIASAMSIELSTVKVYVHRLLQKTDCANRQELTQLFWKHI